MKKNEEQRKRREHNKGNTMVFGDNVRARKAARALPRTPTTKKVREQERKEKTEKTSDGTTNPHTHRYSTTHNTMQ